jgi:GT2 family glycosyltransferase
VSDPLLSVVVTNYNERELLQECLASFERRTYDPVELVVVDDGSTDGSREMVRSEFPDVTLCDAPPDGGMAAVINTGLREASGEVLCANFNNDEVITPRWVAAVVDALQRPGVGVVGGLRIDYENRDVVDSAGAVFDAVGRQQNYMFEPVSAVPDGIRPVDFVEVPVFERELLDTVGYFDDAYGYYGTDVDFCLRAKQAGYDVVMTPEARSFHRRMSSMPPTADTRYYLRRNKLWAFLRYLPAWQATACFLYWGVLRALRETKDIALGRTYVTLGPDVPEPTDSRFAHLAALYRAVLWNVVRLPRHIADRLG